MPNTSTFEIPLDASAEDIIAGIEHWARRVLRDDLAPHVDADRFRPRPRNPRYEAARSLWHILTALRGPDSGNQALKDETTAIIRAATVPTLACIAGAIVKRTQPTSEELAQLRCVGQYTKDHFSGHIVLAVGAISDFKNLPRPLYPYDATL